MSNVTRYRNTDAQKHLQGTTAMSQYHNTAQACRLVDPCLGNATKHFEKVFIPHPEMPLYFTKSHRSSHCLAQVVGGLSDILKCYALYTQNCLCLRGPNDSSNKATAETSEAASLQEPRPCQTARLDSRSHPYAYASCAEVYVTGKMITGMNILDA